MKTNRRSAAPVKPAKSAADHYDEYFARPAGAHARTFEQIRREFAKENRAIGWDNLPTTKINWAGTPVDAADLMDDHDDDEGSGSDTVPSVAPRAEPSISFKVKPIRHVPRILIADFAVKPVFYMGVEFEGMISDESYRDFKRSMCDLAQDDAGRPLIQFGVDGSVKNVPAGYQPVEIRTSVVRSRAGVKLFEEMLCFLYLASQTGDWLTNDTCGLHINISERGVFDSGKQADYYCHVLASFDESAVLSTFGREGNKYCLPFFKDGAAQDYASAKRLYANLKRRERAAADRGADKWHVNEGKYLAVSLRHSPQHDGYAGDEQENQRIEFRCLGNTDYHLRFDELDEAVNHIISVIRLAYREVTS